MFRSVNLRIYILKALAGDCFLLDFNNGSCILIDGGYKSTYTTQLKQLLIKLNNEGKHIEYLILTHYDSDHIGGLLALLEENGNNDHEKIIHIENIICNGFSSFCNKSDNLKILTFRSKGNNATEEISAKQQLDFEKICLINGYEINNGANGHFISQGDVLEGKEYQIKILTPTSTQLNELGNHLKRELIKNNYSLTQLNFQNLSMHMQEEPIINITENISSTYFADIEEWKKYLDKGSYLNLVNQCSLSFEIQFKEKYLLFCGDSDMNIAKSSLQNEYEVIKLSHHGTYYGNECFAEDKPVTATNYIISTNGIHTSREHPSRRLLSEIITLPHHKNLYFNYDITKVKNEMYYLLNNIEQKQKYNFKYKSDYFYFDI